MRHAQVGLQAMMDTRARLESERFYRQAEHEDRTSKARAEFEHRSSRKFGNYEVARRVKRRAEQDEDDLNYRRELLAELLSREEEQYKREVEQSFETPAQRRNRIKSRLDKITKEKEAEHQEEVRQKLYNRWVEECDPLRPGISRAFEQGIIKERDEQVAQHELDRMQEDVAEREYAKEVRRGVKEFRARREQEQEDKRRKQSLNKDIWTAQISKHQDNLIRQRDAVAADGREFRRRNDEDIKQAKRDAEDRRTAQADRRKELVRQNKQQAQYRNRWIEEERRQDEEQLQRAKEELRKEEEDGMIQRLVAKRKANANRELLETQLSKVRESDERSERYIAQVQNEKNHQQDEIWRKDAEKRHRLLMDAKRGQEEQMRYRDESARERRTRTLAQERMEIDAEIEHKRQLDKEERDERLLKQANQAHMLEEQIAMRRAREYNERAEERNSVKALLQGWRDEEERIQEALAHPENFVGRRFRGHR